MSNTLQSEDLTVLKDIRTLLAKLVNNQEEAPSKEHIQGFSGEDGPLAIKTEYMTKTEHMTKKASTYLRALDVKDILSESTDKLSGKWGGEPFELTYASEYDHFFLTIGDNSNTAYELDDFKEFKPVMIDSALRDIAQGVTDGLWRLNNGDFSLQITACKIKDTLLISYNNKVFEVGVDYDGAVGIYYILDGKDLASSLIARDDTTPRQKAVKLVEIINDNL